MSFSDINSNFMGLSLYYGLSKNAYYNSHFQSNAAVQVLNVRVHHQQLTSGVVCTVTMIGHNNSVLTKIQLKSHRRRDVLPEETLSKRPSSEWKKMHKNTYSERYVLQVVEQNNSLPSLTSKNPHLSAPPSHKYNGLLSRCMPDLTTRTVLKNTELITFLFVW